MRKHSDREDKNSLLWLLSAFLFKWVISIWVTWDNVDTQSCYLWYSVEQLVWVWLIGLLWLTRTLHVRTGDTTWVFTTFSYLEPCRESNTTLRTGPAFWISLLSHSDYTIDNGGGQEHFRVDNACGKDQTIWGWGQGVCMPGEYNGFSFSSEEPWVLLCNKWERVAKT